MTGKMFCFQCEQTAGGKACTVAGACGKTPKAANLQDAVTGALIASSAAGGGVGDALLLEALFATLTNVNFDEASLETLLGRIGGEPYDMGLIWEAQEDERTLKSLIVLGCRGIAAYAWHAAALGCDVSAACAFLRKALAAAGQEGSEGLLGIVMECGAVNYEVLGMLDAAHTARFGVPSPVAVPRTVEPGPFIVISGHDLEDLRQLLEQTEGKGVNVYTHGEMLPAHGYPQLRRHAHLKGNFGTAWQNQGEEFDGIPGAILFTTNCLTPPKASYIDRVFTSSAVAFPGTVHLDGKDFTPVIEKALELGGWDKPQGSGFFTTGFGHAAILSNAEAIVGAVKSGAVSRFFLVGGCDGARTQRGYFTEFVEKSPADSIILTLGCGKYRFNGLELGTVAGLPRLLDMGQCNDSFGAVQVALALADAFGCGVNDLPLTLVISWFEQKAVAVLLTLLHLGIKNIILGPTLPAFISPGILAFLSENFGIKAVSTPEEDLAAAGA